MIVLADMLTDSTIDAWLDDHPRALIEWGAAWCAPCRALAPVLARLATERTDLSVATIGTDTSPGSVRAHQIKSLPTMILFLNGRPIARHAGAMDYSALVTWIDRYLGEIT